MNIRLSPTNIGLTGFFVSAILLIVVAIISWANLEAIGEQSNVNLLEGRMLALLKSTHRTLDDVQDLQADLHMSRQYSDSEMQGRVERIRHRFREDFLRLGSLLNEKDHHILLPNLQAKVLAVLNTVEHDLAVHASAHLRTAQRDSLDVEFRTTMTELRETFASLELMQSEHLLYQERRTDTLLKHGLIGTITATVCVILLILFAGFVMRSSYKRLRRTERILRRRVRIANIFLTADDSEMYPRLLQVILDVLDSPFGLIGFLDTDDDLVIPNSVSADVRLACGLQGSDPIPRTSWERREWSRAIREGSAYCSSPSSSGSAENDNPVSPHLVVPILFQQELIGVLQVAGRPTAYIEGDIQTLEEIAAQIAPLLRSYLQRERTLKSMRNLQRAVEHSGDVVFMTDPEGVIAWVNPAFEATYGIPADHAIGENVGIIRDDGTNSEIHRQLWETILSGETYQGEIVNRTARGQRIPMEIVVDPIYGEDAVLEGFISIQRDITERRHAEKQLSASERKYREFFEEDLTGDYISTPEGRLLDCNDAFVRMFEFESKEQALAFGTGLLHPEPGAREALLKLIERDRQLPRHEFEGRTFTGMTILLLGNIIGRFNDKGTLLEIRGYLYDVTEQRRASEQVTRNERRFRALLEHSSDLIGVVDANGILLYQSPAVANILGYRPEELFGRNGFELIHPEDLERVTRIFRENQHRQGVVKTVTYRTRHRDGSWRVMETIATNMIQDEVLQGIVLNSRDITEATAYKQELIEAKDRAELSERLKDAFIANISHEIRTPLNIILGYNSLIESMLQEHARDEELEMFEQVREGASRLMRTVNMILDISRLQVGDLELNSHLNDLNTIVASTVREMRMIAEGKKLELITKQNADHVYAYVDEYSLRQILDNLIGNAIKYTNEGAITIFVGLDGNEYPYINIQDTGIGISDEYLPQLFKPYSQEQYGYTRAYDGVGLGLALVKRYTELNNIKVHVESRKGVGTSFMLRFPVVVDGPKYNSARNPSGGSNGMPVLKLRNGTEGKSIRNQQNDTHERNGNGSTPQSV